MLLLYLFWAGPGRFLPAAWTARLGGNAVVVSVLGWGRADSYPLLGQLALAEMLLLYLFWVGRADSYLLLGQLALAEMLLLYLFWAGPGRFLPAAWTARLGGNAVVVSVLGWAGPIPTRCLDSSPRRKCCCCICSGLGRADSYPLLGQHVLAEMLLLYLFCAGPGRFLPAAWTARLGGNAVVVSVLGRAGPIPTRCLDSSPWRKCCCCICSGSGQADSYPLLDRLGGNAVVVSVLGGPGRFLPAAWTARLGGNAVVVVLFWAGPGRFLPAAWTARLGGNAVVVSVLARLGGNVVVSVLGWAGPIPTRCLDSSPWRKCCCCICSGLGRADSYPLLGQLALAEMLLLYLFWAGPGRFLPAAWTARLGGNAVVVSVLGLARPIPTRCLDSSPWRKCCCCICSGRARPIPTRCLDSSPWRKCCCCICSGSGPGRFLSAAWIARLGGNAVVVSVLGRARPIPTRCLDSSPWRKCCCCICSGLGRADSYLPLGQLALAEMLLLYLFWAGPGRFLPAAWTARLGGNAVVVSVLGRARPLIPRLGGNAVVVSVLGWAGPIPTAAWTARLGGNAVVVSVLGWAGPIPTRCLDSSPWRKCCCCICSGPGRADSYPLLGQLALAEMLLLYLFWAGPGRFLPAAGRLALAEMLLLYLFWAGPGRFPPGLDSSPWRKCCCCISWAGPIPYPLLGQLALAEMLLLYLFWVGPGRFLPAAWTARLGGNAVVVSVLGRASCLDSSPWRKCCCCICSGLGPGRFLPAAWTACLGGNAVVVSVLGRARPIPNRCLDSSPWRKCCCCICYGLGQADSYPLLGHLALAEMLLLYLFWAGPGRFPLPAAWTARLGGNAVVVSVLGWAGPIPTCRLDSSPWRKCCCCICSGSGQADSYPLLGQLALAEMLLLYLFWAGRRFPTRCLDSSPFPGGNAVVVSVLGRARPIPTAAWTARLGGNAVVVSVLGWAGPIPTLAARLDSSGPSYPAEIAVVVSVLGWAGPIPTRCLDSSPWRKCCCCICSGSGPGRFLPAAWTARLGGNAVVVSVLGWAGPIPTRCLDSSPWRKCCCCICSGSGQADSYPLLGQLALAEMLLLYLFWAGPGRFLPLARLAEMLLLYLFWAGPGRFLDSSPWRKCCCCIFSGSGPGRFLPAAWTARLGGNAVVVSVWGWAGPIPTRLFWAGLPTAGTARLGGNAVVVSVLGWAGPIPTRCLDSSPWRKCCCCICSGLGRADSYPLLGQLALAEMLLLYLFWVGPGRIPTRCLDSSPWRKCCCCICSGSGRADSYLLLWTVLALAEMLLLYLFWASRLGGNAVVVSVLGWARPIPTRCLDSSPCGNAVVVSVLGWAGPIPTRCLDSSPWRKCCCCLFWAGQADSTRCLDSSPWRKCCCCICSGLGRADSYRCLDSSPWRLLLYLFWAGPGRFLPAAWTARLGGNAVVVSVLGWAGPIPTAAWTARLGGNAVVVSVLGWAGPIPAVWTARLGSRKCCCCICSGPGRAGNVLGCSPCCCICSGLGRADSYPLLGQLALAEMLLLYLFWAGPGRFLPAAGQLALAEMLIPGPGRLLGQLALAERLLLYLFWAGPCRFLPAAWTSRLGGNAVVVSVLGRARPIPTRCLDSSPWRKCCCCICSGLGRADSYPLLGQLALAEMLLLYLFWVGPGRFLPAAWTARLGGNAVVVSVLGWAGPIPYPLLDSSRKCCCCICSGSGQAVPTRCLDSSPWRKCCCCICSGLGRADSYPLLGQLALAEMLLLYLFWAGPGRFLPAAWTARLGGNAVVVSVLGVQAGPIPVVVSFLLGRQLALGGNAVVVSVLGLGRADSPPAAWTRLLAVGHPCLDSSPWRKCCCCICSGLGRADSYPLLGQLALAEMLLLYLFWSGQADSYPLPRAAWTARLTWRKCCCCICSGSGPSRFLPAAWTARLGGNAVVVSVLGLGRADSYPLLGQLALAEMLLLYLFWARAGPIPLAEMLLFLDRADFLPAACRLGGNAVVVSVLGWAGPIPTRCLDSSPWRKCCCCICSGLGRADSYLLLGQLALAEMLLLYLFWAGPGRFLTAAWTARLGGNAVVVSCSGLGRADSSLGLDSSPWRKCCCCICSGSGRADSYPLLGQLALAEMLLLYPFLGRARPIPTSSPWRNAVVLALAEMLLLYLFWAGPGRFLPAAWTARLGGNAVVVSVLGWAVPIPGRYPLFGQLALAEMLLLYLFWVWARPIPTRCLDSSPWRKCCCCICSGLGRADSYPLLGQLALAGNAVVVSVLGPGRADSLPLLGQLALGGNAVVVSVLGWAGPIPTAAWTARLGGNAVVVSVLGWAGPIPLPSCLDSSPWRKCCCCICSGLGRADSYPLLGQLALAEMLLLYLFWAGPGRFLPAAWTARLGGNAVVVSVLGWARPIPPLPAAWTARLGGKCCCICSGSGQADSYPLLGQLALAEMLLLYLFWLGPGRFLPAAWTARLGGKCCCCICSGLGRADSYRCLDSSPWRKCCCCICSGSGRADSLPLLGQLALAEMLLLYLFWAGPGRFLPAAWTARLGGNAVVVSVLGRARPIPTRCLDSSPWRKCCCCICSGLGRADSYRCLDSSPWRKCCCCICSGSGQADSYPLLGHLFWVGPGRFPCLALAEMLLLSFPTCCLDSSPWRKCCCCICSGAGRADSYPLLGQLALAEMLLLYLFWVRAGPIPTRCLDSSPWPACCLDRPGRFLPAAWTARLGGNAVVVSVLGRAGRLLPAAWTARLGGNAVVVSVLGRAGPIPTRCLDSSPWRKCCCCICSGLGRADSYPLLGQLALAEMLLLYLFWAGPGRFLPAVWTARLGGNAVVVSVLGWAVADSYQLLGQLPWRKCSCCICSGLGRADSYPLLGQLALAEMLLLYLFWAGPGRFLPAAWTARLGGNAVVVSVLGRARPIPTNCLDSSPWRKCCCCICSGLGRADSYRCLDSSPWRKCCCCICSGRARPIPTRCLDSSPWRKCCCCICSGLGRADSYQLLGQLALAEMLLLYLFWVGPGRFLPAAWTARLGGNAVVVSVLGWAGPIPTCCLDSFASPWRKCCCCIYLFRSTRDSSPWRNAVVVSVLVRAGPIPTRPLGQLALDNAVVVSVLGWPGRFLPEMPVVVSVLGLGQAIPTRCLDISPWRKCCCCICSGSGQADSYPLLGQLALAEMLLLYLFWAGPGRFPTRCLDSSPWRKCCCCICSGAGPGRFLPAAWTARPWRKCCCCICSGLGRADSYPLLGQPALAEMLLLYPFWAGPGRFLPLLDSSPWRKLDSSASRFLPGNAVVVSVLGRARLILTCCLDSSPWRKCCCCICSGLGRADSYLLLGQLALAEMLLLYLFWDRPGRFHPLLGQLALAEMLLLYLFWVGPGRFLPCWTWTARSWRKCCCCNAVVVSVLGLGRADSYRCLDSSPWRKCCCCICSGLGRADSYPLFGQLALAERLLLYLFWAGPCRFLPAAWTSRLGGNAVVVSVLGWPGRFLPAAWTARLGGNFVVSVLGFWAQARPTRCLDSSPWRKCCCCICSGLGQADSYPLFWTARLGGNAVVVSVLGGPGRFLPAAWTARLGGNAVVVSVLFHLWPWRKCCCCICSGSRFLPAAWTARLGGNAVVVSVLGWAGPIPTRCLDSSPWRKCCCCICSGTGQADSYPLLGQLALAEMLLLYLFWVNQADSYPLLGQLALAEMLLLYLFWAGPPIPTSLLGQLACRLAEMLLLYLFWLGRPIPTRCLDSSPWRKCCCCICSGDSSGQVVDSYRFPPAAWTAAWTVLWAGPIPTRCWTARPGEMLLLYLFWVGPGRFLPLLGQLALAEMLLLYLFWAGPCRFLPAWTARLWRKCCCCICSGLGRADSTAAWTARLGGNAVVVVLAPGLPTRWLAWRKCCCCICSGLLPAGLGEILIPTRCLDSSPWRKCCCCICSGLGWADSTAAWTARLGGNAVVLFWVGPRPIPIPWTRLGGNAVGQGRARPPWRKNAVVLALAEMLLLYLFGWPGRFLTRCWTARLGGNAVVVSFLCRARRIPTCCLDSSPWRKCCCCICSGSGRADSYPLLWTARLGGNGLGPLLDSSLLAICCVVSVLVGPGRFLPAAWTARLGGNAVVVSVLGWARPIPTSLLGQLALAEMLLLYLFWAGPGRFLPAAWTARLGGNAVVVSVLGWAGPIPTRCLDSSPWRKCCCCIRSGLGRADSYRCLDSSPWRKCCCCICSGRARPIPTRCLDSSPWRKCCCCICSGGRADSLPPAWTARLGGNAVVVSVLGRARPIPTSLLGQLWAGPGRFLPPWRLGNVVVVSVLGLGRPIPTRCLDSSPWRKCCCCICSGLGQADSLPSGSGQLALAEMLLLYLFWAGPGRFLPAAWTSCLGGNAVVVSVLGRARPIPTRCLDSSPWRKCLVVSVLGWAGFLPLGTARNSLRPIGGNVLVVSVLGQARPIPPLLGQLALAEMLLLYLFWAGPGRFPTPLLGQLALAEMLLLYLFWSGPGRFLPAAWTARLGGNAVVVSVLGWARPIPTPLLTARLGGNAVVVSVLGWAGPGCGQLLVVVSVLRRAGPIPASPPSGNAAGLPTRLGQLALAEMLLLYLFCAGPGGFRWLGWAYPLLDSTRCFWTARLGGNAVVVSVLGQARPIPLPLLGQLALAEMLLLYLFWGGPGRFLPAAWTARLGGNAVVVSVLGWAGPIPTCCLDSSPWRKCCCCICSGRARPIPTRFLDSSPWRKCCCCICSGSGQADSYPLLGQLALAGNAVVVSVLGWAGPIPTRCCLDSSFGGNAVVVSVLGWAGPIPRCLDSSPWLLFWAGQLPPWTARKCCCCICSGLGPGRFLPAAWTARLGGNAVVVSVLDTGRAIPTGLDLPTRCLTARLGGNAVVVSVLGCIRSGQLARPIPVVVSVLGWAGQIPCRCLTARLGKCCCCICSGSGQADSYPLLGQLALAKCCCCICSGRARPIPTRCLDSSPWRKCCCCIYPFWAGRADSHLPIPTRCSWTARLGGNGGNVVVSVLGRGWADSHPLLGQLRLGGNAGVVSVLGWARPIPTLGLLGGQLLLYLFLLGGNASSLLLYLFWVGPGRFLTRCLGQLALAEMLLLYPFWVGPGRFLPAAWIARLGGNAVVVSVLGRARPIPTCRLDSSPWRKCCCCICSGSARPIPHPLLGQLLGGNAGVVSVLVGQADSYPAAWTAVLARADSLAEMLLLYLFLGPYPGQACCCVLGWSRSRPSRCLDSSPWRKCCCCICSGSGQADSYPLLGQLALAEMLLLYSVLGRAGPIPTRCLDSSPWRKCCCCICSGRARPIPPAAWTARLGGNAVVVSVLGQPGRFPPAAWTARLGGNAVVVSVLVGQPIPHPLLGQLCLGGNVVVSVLGWARPIPTRCLDSSPWRKCCCCIRSGLAGPIPTRCLDSRLGGNAVVVSVLAGPGRFLPAAWTAALAEIVVVVSFPPAAGLGPVDSWARRLDSLPWRKCCCCICSGRFPTCCLDSSPWRKCCCCICSGLGQADSYPLLDSSRLGGNVVVVSVLGWARPIPTRCLDSLPWRKCCCCICSGLGRPIPTCCLDSSPWRKCCCCICSGPGKADSSPAAWTARLGGNVVVGLGRAVLGWADCCNLFCAGPHSYLASSPWRKCCCCICSGWACRFLPAAWTALPWRKCICCICSGTGRADSYPLFGQLAWREMLLLYLFWVGPGRFLPLLGQLAFGGNAVVVSVLGRPGRFLTCCLDSCCYLGGNVVVGDLFWGRADSDSTRCLDSSPGGNVCCICSGLGRADSYPLLGQLALAEMLLLYLFWPGQAIPTRCLDSSPRRKCCCCICSGLGRADSYPLLGQHALAEMLLLYLFCAGPGRFLPAAWTARLGGNAVVVSVLGGPGRFLPAAWTARLGGNAVVVSVLGRARPIPYLLLGQLALAEMLLLYLSGSGQARFLPAAWTARLWRKCCCCICSGWAVADLFEVGPFLLLGQLALAEMLLLYLFWAGPGRFLPLIQLPGCFGSASLGRNVVVVSVLGRPGLGRFRPAVWTASPGGNAVVVSVLGWAGPIPTRCLDSSPWRKCCCCICSLGRARPIPLPAAWTARPWRKCCCCICSGSGQADSYLLLGQLALAEMLLLYLFCALAGPIFTAAWTARLWRKCCCCICSGLGQADSYPLLGQLALAEMLLLYLFCRRARPISPAAWTARLGGNVVVSVLYSYRCLDSSPWRKCCWPVLGRADSYPLLGQLSPWRKCCCCICSGRARPILTRCLDSSPWRKCCCCCICSGLGQAIPNRAWIARLGEMLLYLFWLGQADSYRCLTARLGGNAVVVSVLGGPGRFLPAAWTALALAEMLLLYLFWVGPGRFLPAAWTARLGGNAVVVSVLGWAGPIPPAAWTARLGGNAVVVSVLGLGRADSYPLLGQLALAEMLLLYLFWVGHRPIPTRCLDSSPWRKCCCCICSGRARPIPKPLLDSSPWRKCCCCICSGSGQADCYLLLGQLPWRKCCCCICSGSARPIVTRCLDSSPWRKCCCCICFGSGQADSYRCLDSSPLAEMLLLYLFWVGPGRFPTRRWTAWTALPVGLGRADAVVVSVLGAGPGGSYPLLGQLALAEMLLLYLFWSTRRFLPAAWTARLGGKCCCCICSGSARPIPNCCLDSSPWRKNAVVLALAENAVVVSFWVGQADSYPLLGQLALAEMLLLYLFWGWAGPIPTRCLDSSPWRKCCCCICSGPGRADSYPLLGQLAWRKCVVVSVLGWAGPIPNRCWTARLGGNAVVVSVLGRARPIPTRCLDSSPWRKCCCCICSGSGQADSYLLLGQLALAEMLLLYLFWVGPGRFHLLLGQLALAEMLLLYLFWAGPGRFLPAAWTARLGGNAVVVSVLGRAGRFLPAAWTARLGGNAVVVSVLGRARLIPTRCLDSSPWRKCCCCICSGSGRADSSPAAWTARLGENVVVVSVLGRARPIPTRCLTACLGGNAVVVSVLVGPGRFLPAAWTARLGGNAVVVSYSGLGQADSYPLLGQLALAEMLLKSVLAGPGRSTPVWTGQAEIPICICCLDSYRAQLALAGNAVVVSVLGGPGRFHPLLGQLPWRKCCCCICSGRVRPIPTCCLDSSPWRKCWARPVVVVSVLVWARPIPTRCLDSSPWRKCCCCICSGSGQADSYLLLGQLALAEMLLLYLFWVGPGRFHNCLDSSPWRKCCCICSGSGKADSYPLFGQLALAEMLLLYLFWVGPGRFLPAVWTARLMEMLLLYLFWAGPMPIPTAAWTARLGGNARCCICSGRVRADSYPLLGQLALAEMLLLYLFWVGPGRFLPAAWTARLGGNAVVVSVLGWARADSYPLLGQLALAEMLLLYLFWSGQADSTTCLDSSPWRKCLLYLFWSGQADS
ncbi:unnamed protein product [Acanthosepion pharaonis]|uniref:Uncharacterized protein n=1 Tax=Acanthosepion pharaonis TaxID=158019 RepID=A0A812BML8_ACAPH|nr:unnamed protein product [Sepia pharaonis]